MFKRLLVLVTLVSVLALGWAGVAGAAGAAVAVATSTSATVTTTDYGVIDWTTGMVRVIGMGASPANGTLAQKKLLARLAAKTDALRRLAECINGVRVDGETLMRDLVVVNDDVRTAVSGLVKNAIIVPNSEESLTESDGSVSYTMMMEAPIVELAAIILRQQQTTVTSTTAVGVATSNAGVAVSSSVSVSSYTGLLVNVQSFAGFQPSLAVRIYSTAGELLYGMNKVSYDYASRSSLATYINSVIDAKQRLQDRIGGNPFTVVAVQVRPNMTDIVVSDADAAIIRQMTTVVTQCKVAVVTK